MSRQSRSLSGLLASLVVAAAAGCSPSPSSAVKASATPTASPLATLAAPTPSPAEASPTPSVSSSPIVFARLPIPTGTSRCHTAQLEVGFRILPPAAGNVLLGFETRNKSSKAYWVYGFVGFQTLDGNGHPLPQVLRWTTNSFFGKSDPPTRILLPMGTSSLSSEPGSGHAFFSV